MLPHYTNFEKRISPTESTRPHYSNKIHALLNDDTQSEMHYPKHDSDYNSIPKPPPDSNMQNSRESERERTMQGNFVFRPIKMVNNSYDSPHMVKSATHTISSSDPQAFKTMYIYNNENQNGNYAKSASQYPVGSYEWESIRKENHKRVERRRREHINAGVSLLASLVPGCGKNKGKVLHQAAQYITQLTTSYNETVTRYTNENLKNQKTISDLNERLEKLEAENERLSRQIEEHGHKPVE